MANEFLDEQTFANAFLLLLTNQLVMGRRVGRRFINQLTDENGLKTSIKRPPQFVAKDGAAIAEQDIVTGSVDLEVTEYKNVHISVGDLDNVRSFNDLMQNETMRSAASTLAHEVDLFLADKAKEFHSEVGTVGETIKSPEQFNAAHTRLMEQSVPNMDLSGVVTFADGEKIRGSLLSGNIDQVNRTALERTRIPILSEVDVFASQNLASVTTGSRTGTILLDGADQNVNYRDVKDTMTQTIAIDGLGGATDTVKKGEVFTIAGVNAINRRTNEDLGYLQQFVVVEDNAASTNAIGDLKISPPIIVPGTNDGTGNSDANTAFATVSAAPADDAAITFAGSASTSRTLRPVFHRQAIELATARLRTPFSGEAAFQVDPETGIGIRVWRFSDGSTGKHFWRFDMIYGATVTDPFMGTRVFGESA